MTTAMPTAMTTATATSVPRDENGLELRDGVAVAILTPDGYVLMRRAAGKTAAGSWSLPGGALDPGETLAQAAIREVLEEVGITLDKVETLPYQSHDIFPEIGVHWTTHYFLGRTQQKPVNLEPHKCDGLFVGWPADFPQPFFVGIPALLEQNLLPPTW